MSKSTNILLGLFNKLGFFDVIRSLNRNTLTVLNYHRIDDPFRVGFNTFKPNVSATPTQFAKQMDYIHRKYNVVTGSEVAKWINGGPPLPPNAAVITFDDGYHDNLSKAYPVLKKYNLPAVIFLTTNYIDSSLPFYWDIVAYAFDHTPKDNADFPLLGKRRWHDSGSRKIIMDEWVERIKTLPEADKKKQIDLLPDILGASIPDDLSANLTLTWSDVRHMSENGIEMGSHTASHPILTRVSLEDARVELEKSKSRIEAEIKSQVVSFAYPNGQDTDFNDEVIECVCQAGYQIAFTLLPGPTKYTIVKRSPFTVRRIFLSYKDSFPRFVGKLIGLSKFSS